MTTTTDYQGIATVIAALGAFITVLAGLIIQVMTFMRQGQIQHTQATQVATAAVRDIKIDALHDAVNGQSEALRVATGSAAFQAGAVAGADEERANPTAHAAPVVSEK